MPTAGLALFAAATMKDRAAGQRATQDFVGLWRPRQKANSVCERRSPRRGMIGEG
jgi:hypothetical protein